MKNADKFVVGGQVYDVLSPATFGDYMETIGSACINPDGYAENKLFLAYDDNVQKLFRATAAIAYSELLIKNTNCEPTTMAEALANALSAGGVSYDNTDSGLTASNVQGAIDEVNGNVETVNNDLSNKTDAIFESIDVSGAVNLCNTDIATQWVGTLHIINNGDGTITLDGTVPNDFSPQNIASAIQNFVPNKQYRYSAVNGNAVDSRIGIFLYEYAADGTYHTNINKNDGNDVLFTPTASYPNYKAVLYLTPSAVFSNEKIYPMIALASHDKTDFIPYYAKTNRELTEESNYVLKFISLNNGYSQNNTGKLMLEKRNGVATFYWRGGSPMIPSANTDYTIGTLPNEFIPKQEVVAYAIHMGSTFKGMYLKLKTDGSIHAYGYATGTNDILNCIPYGTYFI